MAARNVILFRSLLLESSRYWKSLYFDTFTWLSYLI